MLTLDYSLWFVGQCFTEVGDRQQVNEALSNGMETSAEVKHCALNTVRKDKDLFESGHFMCEGAF